MEIAAGLIASPWLWTSWLLYTGCTLLAVIRAAWFRLGQSDSSNIYFGTIVVLLLLWSINAEILPGQGFHFLAVTTMTLMFGWEFAFLAVQVVIAVLILEGRGSWETFALNALLLGALPAIFTQGLLHLSRRFLPRNYFVYIFINAFLAATAGILLIGLATWLLLLANTVYRPDQLENFLLVFAMAAIPEGTLNGMTMSILVVYKPGWVTTFRDEVYFYKKPGKPK